MTTEPTAEDFNSLAGKLDRLDLTDAEKAILDAVLSRAASHEEETQGFSGFQIFVKTAKAEVGQQFLPAGRRLAVSAGVLRMEGEFTDEP